MLAQGGAEKVCYPGRTEDCRRRYGILPVLLPMARVHEPFAKRALKKGVGSLRMNQARVIVRATHSAEATHLTPVVSLYSVQNMQGSAEVSGANEHNSRQFLGRSNSVSDRE